MHDPINPCELHGGLLVGEDLFDGKRINREGREIRPFDCKKA